MQTPSRIMFSIISAPLLQAIAAADVPYSHREESDRHQNKYDVLHVRFSRLRYRPNRALAWLAPG
jgi:hypothetical protein